MLRQRKDSYRRRQPGIVNLISATEMEHFLETAWSDGSDCRRRSARAARAGTRGGRAFHRAARGRADRRADRHRRADTLPHASFQMFRQPDRQVLALSPFRLGEQPNIRVGVAMITSPGAEALALHEKMARELARALKGCAAVELWYAAAPAVTADRADFCAAVREIGKGIEFGLNARL